MTKEQSKAISDNKALQSMVNSKWWEILIDTIKEQRKWRTLDILNNKLLDEPKYTQADLLKEQIRTYSFIIELPNLIKKSNEAIIPIEELENKEKEIISSEDTEDLYVEVDTE